MVARTVNRGAFFPSWKIPSSLRSGLDAHSAAQLLCLRHSRGCFLSFLLEQPSVCGSPLSSGCPSTSYFSPVADSQFPTAQLHFSLPPRAVFCLLHSAAQNTSPVNCDASRRVTPSWHTPPPTVVVVTFPNRALNQARKVSHGPFSFPFVSDPRFSFIGFATIPCTNWCASPSGTGYHTASETVTPAPSSPVNLKPPPVQLVLGNNANTRRPAIMTFIDIEITSTD